MDDFLSDTPVFNNQQQNDVSGKLKTSLQSIRSLIPHVHAVFTWKKQFYPAILSSLITILYFLIWITDTTLLTSLAILSICLVLADYLVPILVANLFDSSKWSSEDEQVYNEFCEEIGHCLNGVNSQIACVCQLRQSNSKTLYLSVLSTLLLLAWLGNTFSGLFLAYVLTLGLAMFPGLKHQGACKQALDRVIKLIKGLISKDKKED